MITTFGILQAKEIVLPLDYDESSSEGDENKGVNMHHSSDDDGDIEETRDRLRKKDDVDKNYIWHKKRLNQFADTKE